MGSNQHSIMKVMANFSQNFPKVTIGDIVIKETLCVQPMVGHPFSNIRVAKLKDWLPTKNSLGHSTMSYKVDESSLYVFSAADKNEVENILAKNTEGHSPKVYGPHDKNFEKIHGMFLTVEARLRRFLKYCRDEKALDDSFLREIYMKTEKFTPFLFAINNFQGYIQYPSQMPILFPSLEDELEARMYMPPLFFGGAEQWVKNRHCDECERIYFYKLERSKFCSERCRMRTVRKK